MFFKVSTFACKALLPNFEQTETIRRKSLKTAYVSWNPAATHNAFQIVQFLWPGPCHKMCLGIVSRWLNDPWTKIAHAVFTIISLVDVEGLFSRGATSSLLFFSCFYHLNALEWLMPKACWNISNVSVADFFNQIQKFIA